ncbi:hypothetical protein V8B55DRAFT_1025592 [Mucor lusitanicus]|uniref:Uncharacterized protein n=2 Tax=Mucor circinelloides f. lusitanicus TaxID=29924 RepID=A0A168JBR7_MUCCL|nr:hypothetical protein FB192DRAFT_1339046 [Mucor lusitanicus]OAD01003.1 hypothetical protein MUCCIDRAFT_112429 [Mucor lusitanicus CBS 277.49]
MNQHSNNTNPRPSLLRSPPSIQLTTYNALAYTSTNSIVEHGDDVQVVMKRSSSSRSSSVHCKSELSRTQHKLLLQRQSFLADDKNYLDHPDNMRRLTKELDRVNREYKCVKQFQDPLALSIKRVTELQQQQQLPALLVSNTTPQTSSAASSWSSSSCSSLSMLPPKLQRRASSHTVHDYLMNFKEDRRHSFNDKSQGFIGRLFGASSMHHSTLSSSQLKRYPHVA